MANTRGRAGRGDDDREHPRATSVWEGVVAAVGALVVLSAVGFMVYQAVTTPPDPVPNLVVRVDSIIPQGAHHLVRIVVRNDGDATAARVAVEAELRADTGVVEQSQTSVDFVPAGSQRRAGLVFTRDPARYQLRLRALGWDEP